MDENARLDVLIVEDAAANLCDILELDGHRVASTGAASAALARPDLDGFAAIVLDRRLPDGLAEDLIPAFQAAAPGAAVVVVTGHSDIEGAVAAMRQGAADYILKPLNAGELRARLVRVARDRIAERARRAAERRYRILVQNSIDLITAFDAEGDVLYQSPSIQQILGRSPRERVGANVFRSPIVHPDDMPAKRAFFLDALRRPGVPVGGTFRLRHADGTYRQIEALGTNLLGDPEVGAITANYRDVTARAHMESALRQSEERFRVRASASR
jgi:PAS domain S-box-containing protein